ncbi:MAG: S41 family peptidase [Chloroflexi bacterium]|nr:S41 family peptidase [Chloroflexota bacterium]
MKRMREIWRRSRVGRSILVTIAIFTTGFAAGSLSQAHTSAQAHTLLGDNEQAFEPLWDAFSIIESSYIDPVNVQDLVGGAIKGMADALGDPHSGYIGPELCPNSRNFSGEFSGIGVTIKTDEDTGHIKVVTVIPDTPADRVGVAPGDVFHKVDGIRVSGMTQAELSALVPGPQGTSVTIVFKRDDALIAFEIVRDVFEIPNVAYDIVGDKIAYISMLGFHDLSRAQLDEAFEAVEIDSATGLIFDIRNNPGGTLASAIEIGSAFIEDGVLLRQVSRDRSEEVTRATGGFANIELPIVVLVDETSASASEVIAGAMQDHGVAAILGETTFGKGTVQNLPKLSNGGCLRITVGRWLRPNGHWIHQQGIRPDIIVERNPDGDNSDAAEYDAQLAAAIQYIESLRD